MLMFILQVRLDGKSTFFVIYDVTEIFILKVKVWF